MILNPKTEFVIKPVNQMVYTFCVDFALSNGINVYDGTIKDKDTDINDYPYLKWYPEKQLLIGIGENTSYVASLDEFIEWCISHTQSKVKINDKYTAIIHHDKKVIEVGCQIIPYDIVLQIYQKMLK